MNNAGVKSFQDLKITFDLPNSTFFLFLQLRHILQSQFGNSTPDLPSIYLVDFLLGVDSKKLTPIGHSSLIIPAASDLTCWLKSGWVADVGELEDDEWTDALAASKLVSPKLSDRLTHLYSTDEMGSALMLCPKKCLLGILPKQEQDRHHHIFMQLCF